MPKMHQTLLLPGNIITEAARLLGQPLEEGQDDDTVLAGPFEVTFNDSHRIAVQIVSGNPSRLMVTLYDQENLVVDTVEQPGSIDQDYLFDNGNITYELTIMRAANTVLTPEAIAAYNASGGLHCPFCGSTDIHAAKPQIDGPQAWCRIECCSCEARWKDLYTFIGISEAEDDWEGPQANVRRQA